MRRQRGRRIYVLTVILVSVISFALFGCDKKTGDNASSETGEKNITATATPTPTAAAEITKPITQDDRILLSSDEAMTLATHIMVATCLGTDETDGVFSYRFRPDTVI